MIEDSTKILHNISAADPKNLLRNSILDAIRETDKYWLLYSEGSYGIAGFFQVPNKKIYIEILFYPVGHPCYPFQIHAVGNVMLNFSSIYEKFPADSEIVPANVLVALENLVSGQSSQLLTKLENELTPLEKEYFIIKDKDQHFLQTINFYYSNITLQLIVNWSHYPLKPEIKVQDVVLENKVYTTFRPALEKAVQAVQTVWVDRDPPIILEFIHQIDAAMSHVISDSPSFQIIKSHGIIAQDLTLGQDARLISFSIHRGQNLGIHTQNDTAVDALFRALTGKGQSLSGNLQIFGIDYSITAGTPSADHNKVIELNHVFTKDESQKSIKQMISHNQFYRPALKATLLEFDLSKKLKDCSPIELLRIQLAMALVQNPGAILFKIPENILGKLDIDQILRILRGVKQSFDTILIVHAPKSIVEGCDEILPISSTGQGEIAGTIEELSDKLPQSGEILLIQLTNPNEEQLNFIRNLPNTQYIELRSKEKFKLFSTENPDQLTAVLFDTLGSTIYNFQRSKPRLGEYLEFLQYQGRSMIIK